MIFLDAPVTTEWLLSITEVILAGPPFMETITNSFRLKLNDLICYYDTPTNGLYCILYIIYSLVYDF